MAFKHKNKKRAFSLVELMMLLLVSSLIIAALVPVVTKKHFRLPSMVVHGAYMCYYKNGELYEAKWSGKNQQNVVYDRPTDQCVFSPPQKAAYFQISAIGGGGGGGDAGYTGGDPIGGWSSPKKLSPFNVTATETPTSSWNLEDKNISSREFLENAGVLWVYAKGGDSGGGGMIGYSTKTHTGDTCIDPVYSENTYCADTMTSSSTVSATECYEVPEEEPETPAEGETETPAEGDSETTSYNTNIFSRIAAKLSNFFTDTIALKTFGKGVITGAATSDACSLTLHIPHESCEYEQIWHDKTCYTSSSCTSSHQECEMVDETREVCTQEPYTTLEPNIVCSNGGSFTGGAGITGDQSDGCRQQGMKEVTKYKEVCHDETYQTESCTTICDSMSTPEPYNCGYYTQGALIGCSTSYTDSVSFDRCEGETTCTEVSSSAGTSYCTRYETETTQTGCNEYEPVYTWGSATQGGNSGASGATCASGTVDGQLNLAPPSYPARAYNGSNGTNFSTSGCGSSFCADTKKADDGTAPCISGQKQSCGSGDVSYSEASLGGQTVRAMSASAAGGGGGRSCTPNSEGECVDYGVASNLFAEGGYCDAGHTAGTASINGYPDVEEACGSGYAGYCLAHDNNLGFEAEGQYNYNSSYDNNYLNYGEPGSPGQFKTIIVRSLKDIDTTIKIGRGGSAAAFNLGQDGAKGSATSMGNIIYAEGGEGGRGGISKSGSVLPKFDKEIYDLEERCYGKSGADRPAECNVFGSGSDYQFHIVSGRTFGEYPTPVGFASSIMTFIFNTADNSEAIQKFIKYGRGGAGGGVEHRCWAGRFEVEFEGKIMLDTSVFPSKEKAAEAGATQAIAEHRYVPEDCRDDWDNVPAGPGSDGSLLIKC